MKNLKSYVQEAFRINKDYKPEQYSCQPKTKDELKQILAKRLEKDKNADLNDIDVSNIENMYQLFYRLDPYDIDISEWDVSKVETMDSMFAGCKHFDADLSKWDVSKVTNMRYMFYNCSNFEGKGLENLDVSKVTQMESMFANCEYFDCDLSNWDVSKVLDTSSMFYKCESFEGKGLENWNMSSLQSSGRMFYGCYKLNVDLSSWKKPANIFDRYGKMFTGCILMKQTGSKRIPKWWSWAYDS